MINQYICPIEGDLSRADVVALTLLCRDKNVVEFGIGGSTILLSQVAKSLTSYETEQSWIDQIKQRLAQLENKTCEPVLKLIERDASGQNIKNEGFECDVLFDDGWSCMRDHFLFVFWPYIKECAILHDSRMTYPWNVLKKFFDKWQGEAINVLPHNLYTGTLKSIDCHWLESNMVVLHKRNIMLKHEDWKQTEKGNNRVGWGL